MILAAQMVREFVRDVDPHAPPEAAYSGTLPPAFEPPNCDFIMIVDGPVAGTLAALPTHSIRQPSLTNMDRGADMFEHVHQRQRRRATRYFA